MNLSFVPDAACLYIYTSVTLHMPFFCLRYLHSFFHTPNYSLFRAQFTPFFQSKFSLCPLCFIDALLYFTDFLLQWFLLCILSVLHIHVFCYSWDHNWFSRSAWYMMSMHEWVSEWSDVDDGSGGEHAKKRVFGNSPAVQWLGLHAFTAEGPGFKPRSGN